MNVTLQSAFDVGMSSYVSFCSSRWRRAPSTVLLNDVVTKDKLLLLSRKVPVSTQDGHFSWFYRVSRAPCAVCHSVSSHAMLHIARAATLRVQYCYQLVAQCFIVICYRSDMFRPQLSTIFRELATLQPCVAYVSTDVAEILHLKHALESVSVGNKPQVEL